MGILIGLALPLVVYGLILLVLLSQGQVENFLYRPNPAAPALAAIFSNLFPFRYYMVTRKFDRTGRGILIVTFVKVLLLFAFIL